MESRFEFGFQLFTVNDEVVRLNDVERFYWAVKRFNLQRMREIFGHEANNPLVIQAGMSKHLASLRSLVDAELDLMQIKVSNLVAKIYKWE